MNETLMRAGAIALCAALIGFATSWGSVAEARNIEPDMGVNIEPLLTKPMAGEPGKEIVSLRVAIPPGLVLPWHTHPDIHEVVYMLEGDFVVEVKGQGQRQLKPGESAYVPPNAVHRGMNKGDVPVKLLIVRVKPTGTPMTEKVEPSDP
jgi:quercetin dioxygenase-like cupin family protein